MDKILGATAVNGQIQFVFKWVDCELPTLVSSDEAKTKYTYHVLDFYEKYLVWHSDDEADDAEKILKWDSSSFPTA